MSQGTTEIWFTIVVLTVVVVLLRNVFLLAPREWRPRGLTERALRYAPIAALAALVSPEIVRDLLQAPALSAQWLGSARLLSALALIVTVRLTRSAVAGIVIGTAVFLWLDPA